MKTTRATQFEASVFQSMSTTNVYSDVVGHERTEGGQFHVLSFKPWVLQVSERIDGVWHLVHHESFMRKGQAIADAERQGIVLDYVSHHKDYVRSCVLGQAA